MTTKLKYTIIDDNIFWNTFAQECYFAGVHVKLPSTVHQTGDKLAAVYPDPNDAEMFIRSQFVMPLENDLLLTTIVHSFKDFIGEKHHKAYEAYKKEQWERVMHILDVAYEQDTFGTVPFDSAEVWQTWDCPCRERAGGICEFRADCESH